MNITATQKEKTRYLVSFCCLVATWSASAQTEGRAEWYHAGYEMGLQAGEIAAAFGPSVKDVKLQLPMVLQLLGAPASEISSVDMKVIEQGWIDGAEGSAPAIEVPTGPTSNLLPLKLRKARSGSTLAGVFEVGSINKWKKAVVMLKTKKGHGTGFFIAPGKILTNRHVIEEVEVGEAIKVLIEDDREVSGKVFARSEDKDLALISVDESNHAVLNLGDSDEAQVGSSLGLFGYPILDTLSISFNQGTISTVGVKQKGSYGVENVIKVDISANPGNSGGPLVDVDGKVIAVLTSGYDHITDSQGFTFGVVINEARGLIADHAPEVFSQK
jgi:S1-C subfamily serine protease